MANLTGGNDKVDVVRIQGDQAPLDQLSDSLHRGFASSSSPAASCWLLLDPSPLGMHKPNDPGMVKLLNDHALARVKPSRAGIPLEMSPSLLPLDQTSSAGSTLIRSSLALALGELPSPRLAQGAGRVIAAWLECDGSVDAARASLERHFACAMFASRADGRIEWLRWYDPAVLWLLWPHLIAAQQCVLLGPIRRYWLLTPSATLACLSRPGAPRHSEKVSAKSASIAFTSQQWAIVDGIGPLNVALTQIQASELDSAAFARAAAAGMCALARAQKAGFSDRRDLARYAHRAMTCHPEFDSHALIADLLRERSTEEFFTAVVDDITDLQWNQIANDLKAID